MKDEYLREPEDNYGQYILDIRPWGGPVIDLRKPLPIPGWKHYTHLFPDPEPKSLSLWDKIKAYIKNNNIYKLYKLLQY